MTTLSDTALMILGAGCAREDRIALPLPASLKGAAIGKAVASLIGKGLLAEVATGAGQPEYRRDENENSLTLVVTDAAFSAMNLDGPGAEGGATIEAPQVDERATRKAERAAKREADAQAKADAKALKAKAKADKAAEREVAAKAKADARAAREAARAAPGAVVTPRDGTKQAKMIGMLRRAEGATVAEIQAETGWQPHTVRGAFAGALPKKLGLRVEATKEERGRVYRIAA